MKDKWILYAGLLFLSLGIVLKFIIYNANWPIILIISGILLKLIFVLTKIKRSDYRPGYEMFLLIAGLTLFLTGMYMWPEESSIHPNYLKVSGISLKVIFVILLLHKTKDK